MSQVIAKAIEQTQDRFNNIAPSAMKYEAEKGFAIQLLTNNSYLMKVATENPKSLQQALTNVAAIGLSLNPAEKLAYLIPRSVKAGQDKWETRVFLEPSYVGLIRLATNSGSIKWVQSYCVYENDKFMDNGSGEKPTHTYDAFAKERGEFIGVYCVAKTMDGDFLTTIMPASEVYSIRDRSESYKKYQSGVWVTDFNEMAKKAVVRRGFKTWPRTDENNIMAHAVDLSNANEGFEQIVSNPNLSEYTAEQKEYFNGLIENSDSLGMLVFQKSIDVAIYTSLYHSFGKGEKGKYQKIVDKLAADGVDVMQGIIDQLADLVEIGDNSGIVEIVSELKADELELILNNCSPQISQEVNQINNEAA